MSLTKPHTTTERIVKSLIKNCIPSKELFYSPGTSICFDTKKKSVINYGLDSKSQSSLCGTAFDYLARFLIARVAKNNKNTVLENLVTERLLNISQSTGITEQEYKQMLISLNQYINGKNLNEDILIDICIILAKMELTFRSGNSILETSNFRFHDHKNSIIKTELKQMLDSFKRTFLPIINESSQIVYNPHFGIGSRIIGGADADIFIDGILYDFKTSIKNGYNSKDVTQIIGYFILDAIAKRCNDQRNQLCRHSIKKVALYKVRYEEFAFFDIENLSIESIDNTINSICHTYLMYNISHLLLDERFENIKEKYSFPLTTDELKFCSEMASYNLKCYLQDEDNLDEFIKEERDAIINAQSKMNFFLSHIDVVYFFRELVKIHNSNFEKLSNEMKDRNIRYLTDSTV